jgi:hypothetical protein
LVPVTLNQIHKPLSPFHYTGNRVIHLGGRIPQNVKLEVARRAAMRSFEASRPHMHDLPGDCQSSPGILRITARPKLGADLKSRDFAATSHHIIIVAGFKH